MNTQMTIQLDTYGVCQKIFLLNQARQMQSDTMTVIQEIQKEEDENNILETTDALRRAVKMRDADMDSIQKPLSTVLSRGERGP